MPWSRIEPVATITKAVVAVTVKVRKPTRGKGSKLFVTINPDRIDGGLNFWRIGSRVGAMVGTGQHEGFLRVERGDDFKLTTLGAKAGKGSVTLILPLPACVRPDDLRRVAADVADHSDQWIEIAIPKALRRRSGDAGGDGGNGTTVVVEQSRQSGNSAPFRTSATTPGAPRPAAGGR